MISPRRHQGSILAPLESQRRGKTEDDDIPTDQVRLATVDARLLILTELDPPQEPVIVGCTLLRRLLAILPGKSVPGRRPVLVPAVDIGRFGSEGSSAEDDDWVVDNVSDRLSDATTNGLSIIDPPLVIARSCNEGRRMTDDRTGHDEPREQA